MSPLQIFFTVLAFFHISEFTLTALFNKGLLSRRSWLISTPYVAAMSLALVEHFLELKYFPALKTKQQPLLTIGILLVILGELIRKIGIITARHNFTHEMQFRRREEHHLVTTGIYAYIRHPGYLGWFLWAVATQCILCNPICIVLFTVVVWNFMKRRIAVEDRLLTNFFKQQHAQYVAQVPSGIPFIS